MIIHHSIEFRVANRIVQITGVSYTVARVTGVTTLGRGSGRDGRQRIRPAFSFRRKTFLYIFCSHIRPAGRLLVKSNRKFHQFRNIKSSGHNQYLIFFFVELFHSVVIDGQDGSSVAHLAQGMPLLLSTHRFRDGHRLPSQGMIQLLEKIQP